MEIATNRIQFNFPKTGIVNDVIARIRRSFQDVPSRLVFGGPGDAPIEMPGIQKGDQLLAVIEVDRAGVGKDTIEKDHSSTAEIVSDGAIQLPADTTGKDLLVIWVRGVLT